jgi:antibiotic biosynthesis monooxygenase (ABM) superfamily enzyme
MDKGSRMSGPKKWKMAIIVWIAIVPLVFTIMPFFKPVLINLGLNEFVAELLLTTAIVIIMVFVAQPLLMKLFRGWLDE